jgi:hypothetical protein
MQKKVTQQWNDLCLLLPLPCAQLLPHRNVLLKARCLSTRVSDAILEYAEAKNKFEKQQPSVVSPRVEAGGSAGREDRAAGLRRILQQVCCPPS